MVDKLFTELFGEERDLNEMFNEFFDYIKEFEKDEDNKEIGKRSYFHKITDEYKNGKKVSHTEKEVKNGNVIKDINENYKLEDKTEKTKDGESEMSSEEALNEAKKLLDEARSTILMQMREIERSQKRCKELEEELNKFKTGIRALL